MIHLSVLNKLSALAFLFVFLFGIKSSNAQDLPISEIKKSIEFFKSNDRGPYKGINWFCEDGTIREARDPCPGKLEGVQHASYRDDTKALMRKHHLFFGEILASTDRTEFWDESNENSRVKQYQLNRYLESVDDGWIQRKSQFYRGAIQSEDEEAWGEEFYQKFLPNDNRVTSKYFLLRQSMRDIPHDGDSNLAQEMRSQSKIVAEQYPKFMDARIKIHGNPTKEDIQMVVAFKKDHEGKLSQNTKKVLDDLLETMKAFYAPVDVQAIMDQVNKLSSNNDTKARLLAFLAAYKTLESPEMQVSGLADITCVIRTNITNTTSGNDRLLLLDLSNTFEDILLQKTQEWTPTVLTELMEKIRQLSLAAASTGLLEMWEYEKIKPQLELHLGKVELNLEELNSFLDTSRSVVEWSVAMIKATYFDDVETYTKFEPLAYGFIDDRVRSSVALDLGESVSELGNLIALASSLQNDVLNLKSQSSMRGLNPGYALGELVVVDENTGDLEIDSNKIYIFEQPPSDLKPVAGIMTVSEGNLVSHVQLLARNLGIPNAALSGDNLNMLKKYHGDRVFYAVSEKGNIIVKEEDDMSSTEKDLFSKKERNKEKIAVPVRQIRLDICDVLNMRNVNASDSGKLCGPKAANLGQLKSMFPENVVEGLVIPFGIFREHMEQKMPDQDMTYWEYLSITFTEADKMRSEKVAEAEVERYQLNRLSTLKAAIEKMPMKEKFINDLKSGFTSVFGKNIGNVPVFLRSDTNMEDLEDFTGAGLNLTLFNILSEEKIINGIKQVWASPYTERSFKWRQVYLNNPENVYPSILIIPSVDVEYSGVMITKGINSGNKDDLTVAFSRGAGGAVDGQKAETRLITPETDYLLAPARESHYLRLPSSGGTTKNVTSFENQILNQQNIASLRKIASEIKTKIPEETKTDYKGAWDVELGFENDKLWLFQIRPFVENSAAKSSEYLSSIAPEIDYTKKIHLYIKLK